MLFTGQKVKINAVVLREAIAKGHPMVQVKIDGKENPVWIDAIAVEDDSDDRK